MKQLLVHIVAIIITLTATGLVAQDWPIFKGNIYFTGNNDEVIVKNNNLKWLYQADERVFNPVVSDGRVFFSDIKSNVYCLDEEYGKVQWRVDFKQISSQFKALSRSAGKIKYPLVKDNMLFLSDPIAMYAFDKHSGRVLWARTGMRTETVKPQGLSGRTSAVSVDGIYADPIIMNDKIFYGTRNMFLAREVVNGHELWENRAIKTYSAFPTYYDNMIITQSMDYATGLFTVHCLAYDTGKTIWERRLEKPLQIFPPVVYRQRVYIPTGRSLYCLDLKTGDTRWSKEYGAPITSTPSFTDRAILFTVNNSDIAVINPDSGERIRTIPVGTSAGPLFVTIRDLIYIAYNESVPVKGKPITFGRVRAMNFDDNTVLWEYRTPFPGAVSQPIASKGILILPAGNYVYALGTEYYARVVDGGDGYAVKPGGPVKPDGPSDREGATKRPAKHEKKPEKTPTEPDRPDDRMTPGREKATQRKEPPKLETRKFKVTITDENKRGISAQVEIKKWDKDKLVYSKKADISSSGEVEVPTGDNVEILATASGYLPKKTIIGGKDAGADIHLERLEKGKGYVVDNILFDFDKWYLKKASIDIVGKLVMLLKRDPSLRLEVRGHTDSVGDPRYNKRLSERRADAVIEYMVKNGISPERLSAVGMGSEKPIASNTTPEGRRKNRRTEFFFKN